MMDIEERVVPCRVCGELIRYDGIELCDFCWQVVTKLGSFSSRHKAKYVDKLNKALEEDGCSLRVKTDVPSQEEVAIAAKKYIQEKYHQLQREYGAQCEMNAMRKRQACEVMSVKMDGTFDWWGEFLKFVEGLKTPQTGCPLEKLLEILLRNKGNPVVAAAERWSNQND